MGGKPALRRETWTGSHAHWVWNLSLNCHFALEQVTETLIFVWFKKKKVLMEKKDALSSSLGKWWGVRCSFKFKAETAGSEREWTGAGQSGRYTWEETAGGTQAQKRPQCHSRLAWEKEGWTRHEGSASTGWEMTTRLWWQRRSRLGYQCLTERGNPCTVHHVSFLLFQDSPSPYLPTSSPVVLPT